MSTIPSLELHFIPGIIKAALGPVQIESYLQLLSFSFQLFGYLAIGPFQHERLQSEFELFF